MKTLLPNDTDPTIEAILIEGYRAMSVAEKAKRVEELTNAVRELALADVRKHYPNATPHEQALRVASRWIEPELMLRAFGWDVEKEGY